MNNASSTLWCINIHGPDDIVAAPDYITAVRMANIFNAQIEVWKAKQPQHDLDARIWAVPIEYPHSSGHAENLTNTTDEYQWLRAHETIVRPAAPVEGLEYDRIINHVNSYGTTHEEDPRRIYTKCQLDLAIRLASKTIVTRTKLDDLETVVVSYGNDLVSRSQAVAIIAAERAKAEEFADEIKEAAYEVWPEANDVGSDAPDIIRELGKERDACQTEAEDLKNKLYRAEADNAALTARIKELSEDRDSWRRVSERLERDSIRQASEKEALETQLAAAKKALEWYEEHVSNCRKIGSIGAPSRAKLDRDGGAIARAALEAKP